MAKLAVALVLAIASLCVASPARGGNDACVTRPEVQAYLGQIRTRMYARWIVPVDAPPTSKVSLRFALDTKGSVVLAEVASASDPKLGKGAVDALRAAAPFPTMTEPVRCLAGLSLVATFALPSSGP